MKMIHRRKTTVIKTILMLSLWGALFGIAGKAMANNNILIKMWGQSNACLGVYSEVEFGLATVFECNFKANRWSYSNEQIIHKSTGYCLTVKGSVADGSDIDLRTCVDDGEVAARQRWFQDGPFLRTRVNTNLVLGGEIYQKHKVYAKLKLKSYSPADKNQMWNLPLKSERIFNAHTGECLAVGESFESGNDPLVYYRHTVKNKSYLCVSSDSEWVQDSSGALRAKDYIDECLTIGVNMYNRPDMIRRLAPCDDSPEQKFFFNGRFLQNLNSNEMVVDWDRYGNNTILQIEAKDVNNVDHKYYLPINYKSIKNIGSGKCLTPENGKFTNGTKIVSRACDSSDNKKQWYMDTHGLIRNKQAFKKCMRAQYGFVFGTNSLEIWDCDKVYAQQFYFDGEKLINRWDTNLVIQHNADNTPTFESLDNTNDKQKWLFSDIKNPVANIIFSLGTGDYSIYDNSANNFGATVTSDRFGSDDSAYYFDGVDDYMEIPNHTSLETEQYTISVWIKPKGVPNQYWSGIIGKPGRNANIWLSRYGQILHNFKDKLTEKWNFGPPKTPANSVQWEQWNHVVITNDGLLAKTYVNGKLLSSGKANGGQVKSNGKYYIGSDLDGNSKNYFKGEIDDILIYDQALNVGEIYQLYYDNINKY